MSCSELEHSMMDLIDGRLGRADEVRLHAHLEGCPGCRERLQTLRAMVPLMRGLEPPPPELMDIRRMEMAIERELSAGARTPARRQWRWWWTMPTGVAAAAAAVALWVGATRAPSKPPTMALLVELSGPARHDGRVAARGEHLYAGSRLTLSSGARGSVEIGRAAMLTLAGATLRIVAPAPHVVVALDDGVLEAHVAPRRPGEELAVEMPDGRVEVRGTRFTVAVRGGSSTVSVTEGLVAAISRDGAEHLVSPGETFTFGAPTTPPAASNDTAPAEAPDCSGIRRACEDVARRARDSMRAGHPGDAAAALGRFTSRSSTCVQHLGGCGAEVGYLRAEALRMDGDLDGALAAYRGLDRPSAPAPTRQNALIAAGNLERRRGALRAALRDYERAVAVFPRGPLSEEAMAGAMDVASGVDPGMATAAARRYLESFPSGVAAPRARRLLEQAGRAGASGRP